MNKRTKTPPPNESVFRDSDFAGSEPLVQAQLSASLNTLSSRVTKAKQTLADLSLGKAPGVSEMPSEPPTQTPEEGGQTDPPG